MVYVLTVIYILSQSGEEAGIYKKFVEKAVIEAIERGCECIFPPDHLLEASFSCESSPNLTTYRNALIGTHEFNATELINFIQDWVNSGSIIKIQNYSVRVDSTCLVAISSLEEVECGQPVSQCPYSSDPNFAKCVEHLGNTDIANCVNSCIVNQFG